VAAGVSGAGDAKPNVQPNATSNVQPNVTSHVTSNAKTIFCRAAWLHDARSGRGGWREHVLLEADGGRWTRITPDVAGAPSGVTRIDAPIIPSLVDAHCHAFQRAFAGLAERREGGHDDFWSWRDRMYGVALSITPDRMREIATALYRSLRAGGYGHVCEFHYLHHDADGSPYADPIEMARSLVDAAQAAGIGITLLPVVYERAGFAQPALRDDQRRFAADLDFALRARDAVRALRLPGVHAGLALHSLRAVKPETLARVDAATSDDDGAIHIHVAEQTAEVDACLAATGMRPVEWLVQHVPLDARWQLVHATHVTRDEIAAVRATGAGIVICPTTEANLGDGLTDLPAWLDPEVPITIGSDSNVCLDAFEELRWLEYGQRLALRRRNVAAAPERGWSSSGERLFEACGRAGAQAAGVPAWGLEVGAPAVWHELALDIIARGPSESRIDVAVFG
jgi:formimidoylglutamate deiminase